MPVHLPLERGLSSLLTALLLIGLHHVPQRVIESMVAEQLEKLVATALPDVFHDLRHYQAYTLFLQEREQRTQGLRRRIVHIIHGGRIDAEPAYRRLRPR